MSRVTVRKLDWRGEEMKRWRGILERRRGSEWVLEATFSSPRLDLGYMVFAPGDRMVEHYYTDRWYNVLEIYASQGHALKGWYCNLCRPARVKGAIIEVEDLALDLFVSPSGATLVLDEDEFALLPLPAAERHQVEAALADLRARARNAQSPFEQLLEGKPCRPEQGQGQAPSDRRAGPGGGGPRVS